MNDIEIIKNIIYSDNGAKMEYIDINNILDNECKDFIEAIENLIQRNKDLEEIEREHKEENGRLREKNINLKEKIIRQQEQLNIANKKILAQRGQLKVVNNSYIPISKLKEKMELLREDIQYSANPLSIDNSKYAIEVLEELLEEGE